MGEDVAAAQDVTAMDPDHFQIEAIVAKQKAGSGHQYFLKWLEYPDTGNTWEPAKRVEKTAPDLVATYERGGSASTQQAAARAARVANRAAFQAPVESADDIAAMDTEARGAAQKAIGERIRKYSRWYNGSRNAEDIRPAPPYAGSPYPSPRSVRLPANAMA